MDEEELLERAEAFAKADGCTIGERLGFGIHRIVIVLKSERPRGQETMFKALTPLG